VGNAPTPAQWPADQLIQSGAHHQDGNMLAPQNGPCASVAMLANLTQRFVQPIVQIVLRAQVLQIVDQDNAIDVLIETIALIATHAQIAVQIVEFHEIQDITGRTRGIRELLGALRGRGRGPGGRGRKNSKRNIKVNVKLKTILILFTCIGVS